MLPISTSLSYSFGVLSCSFVWSVFFHCFLLTGFLCLWIPFCRFSCLRYPFLVLMSAPWWAKLVKGLRLASWWERLVPAQFLVELSFIGFIAVVGGAVWGVGLEAACLLKGRFVFPPCWLFGLGLLGTDGCNVLGGARFFQNGSLQGELTPIIIPWVFCLQCLTPQCTAPGSCLPGGPPRSTGMFDLDSHRVPALSLDPVHVKPCVCSSGVDSVSLSLVELLHSIPEGLKCQILWGSSSQCQTAQAGCPDMGFGMLTPVG